MSTKTFNRRPYSVATPSSSDIKDYHFNHFNWKGMSTDKNFLAADQETFEQCNNVYADEEGILRSRPALQTSNKFPSCERFWTFGDVVVYLVNEGTPKLKFPGAELELSNSDVLLVKKFDKIFCFTKSDGFKYYDIDKQVVANASDYVYIPTTKIVSSTETDNEARNLLSSRTVISYLYDSSVGVPFGLKDGDVVKVIIDDREYEITFDKQNTPVVLFEKKMNLPYQLTSSAILSAGVLNGSDILVAYDPASGDAYISYDLSSWQHLGRITNNDGDYISQGISKDGLLFYVNSTRGVIVIDTLTTTNKYNVFTNIASYEISDVSFMASFITSTHYVIAKTGMPGSPLFHNYTNISIFDDGEEYSYTKDMGADSTHTEIVGIDCKYNSRNVGRMDVAVVVYDCYNGNYDNLLYTNFGAEDKFEQSVIGMNWECRSISIEADSLFLTNPVTNNVTWQYDLKTEKEKEPIGKYPFGAGEISIDGRWLITNEGILNIAEQKLIEYINLAMADPGPATNNLYYTLGDGVLYSNNITSPIEFKREIGSVINSSFLNKISQSISQELNAFYIAKDTSLYISEDRYDDDGNFLWYFPEYTKQEFAKPITNLFPISANEMAVFFDDEIWYSSHNEGAYSYYKSKLPVGLKAGSDVIVSYDGGKVIFATDRGLATLSYQDFVASSEQTLNFLSDPIHKLFKEFVKNPIKICRHQYWYLCYSTNNKVGYLFDVRNNSWWPLESPEFIEEFFVFDNELFLFKNKGFLSLNKTDDDYKDKFVNAEYDINWNFKSQKLHLGAINYNKHIANITLYSVLDSDKTVRFKMDVNNYRKKMDVAEIQSIEYKVDAIRTFVKRVSYFKVTEFQYNMHQDDEDAIKLPLSLSGISVKYRISGEVR